MKYYLYNETFDHLYLTVEANNIDEAEKQIFEHYDGEWKLNWHNGDDLWKKYRVEFYVEEWWCYTGYFYVILTENLH